MADLTLEDMRRALHIIKALDPTKKYLVTVDADFEPQAWENLVEATKQFGIFDRVLFVASPGVQVLELDPARRYLIRWDGAIDAELATYVEQKLDCLGVKARVLGVRAAYEVKPETPVA